LGLFLPVPLRPDLSPKIPLFCTKLLHYYFTITSRKIRFSAPFYRLPYYCQHQRLFLRMILQKVQPAAGAVRKSNTWKLPGEKISVRCDHVSAVDEISRIGIGL